jgi:acyl-CoA synthetase (AMP-forming)/AMP-acid ligase II
MSRTALRDSYLAADASEPVLELSCGDLLREAARDAPDRPALVEVAPAGEASLTGAGRTDRSWTYEQLLSEAESCARRLLEGYRPGDRIVVWAPNIPEWVILQYGCALAGLVLVTANPALRAGELRYVLEQSRASGLFYAGAFRDTDMAAIAATAAEGLPELRERFCFEDWQRVFREGPVAGRELPAVAPGEPAQIQYTSGTTGFPKGALLHHRGLVTNARYIWIRGEGRDRGTFVSAMPLFHTAGCAIGVLGGAHLRATYLLLQRFEPGLMLEAVERHQAEAILGVPTMLIAVLDHPRFGETDVSSIRIAMSGGASVPSELVRRVEDAFSCRFTTVYGQTELSPIVTQTSPHDNDDDRTQTVGRPLWNVELKIADLAGAIVPVGEQGEICARGYQTMLEYFDLPDRTSQTIDSDGWLHTGDLGRLDSRGYLQITGRLKDMIIRGGENIYPAEIEQALFSHPQIADLVVVGVPDPQWGERIAAVVRPSDPADPPDASTLHIFCRQVLAPHKTPTDWYVADAFPLTGSGKIKKHEVKEQIAAGAYEPLR